MKPGVRRATARRSTSGSNGLPLACTVRIAWRPLRSGRSTAICRSKRPGRSSAGSRMSGPVRGRDEDDAALDVEAVHLDQQLVERLLTLVVTAAEPGTAVPADRVDLVDEDDGRRVGLGLLEQVADPAGADADEHLDEVGARRSRRTARRPRRRRRGPAGSCRCPEGRTAGRPWGSSPRRPGTSPAPARNSLISSSSSTASSAPATSANVVLGVSLETTLAFDLPNCMTREPPPCIWFITKKNKATTSRMIGRRLISSDVSRPCVGFFPS